MQCVNCAEITRKYKCSKCLYYSCSFECYQKHKDNLDLCVAQVTDEVNDKVDRQEVRSSNSFKTEDYVDECVLAKLDNENIKDLLRNCHLRNYLKEIDKSENVWKAMKLAMFEPIFIEFANECLKTVENDDVNYQR